MSKTRSRTRTLFALIVGTLVPASAVALGIELAIVGLNTELEKAVREHLTLQSYLTRDPTNAQIERLIAQSEGEIRETLETFGYYAASVASRVTAEGDLRRVTLDVTMGPPVLVESASVEIAGAARDLDSVRSAAAAFRPRVGERFDHVLYESSKARIQKALVDVGFLDAQLRTHEVQLTAESRTATISLAWDSGERHRFGAAAFSTTHLDPEVMDRFLPWRAGDYYSSEKLLQLQQRLIDADYFSLVSVEPRRERETNNEIPVDIELLPAKQTVYTGSLYGSTDTGAGVQGGFKRRWLNPAGHKLNASVDYAQLKQEVVLGYTIPLRGQDFRSLSTAGSYKWEVTDSSESKTAQLTTKEVRQWHGWTRSVGLTLLGGDFEIGSERGDSVLLYAEGTVSKSDSDNPAFPRRGQSLVVGARLASESLLSDTGFVQIGMRAKRVDAIGSLGRLISRLTLGAMAVDDFDELPPELRFFAGGDRSIRGFDYESVGSTNEVGDVIGGTYLIVGSVEYERYFGKDWGLAAFVDAGDAFLKDEFDANIGVGMGLRWRSPVGVVRIDVGVPVQSKLESGARLHVVIGPDL